METWNDYLRLFDGVNGEIAVGEASVCYLWSPTAAQNIASRIPNARSVAQGFCGIRLTAHGSLSGYGAMQKFRNNRGTFRDQLRRASARRR